jgi:hypothetical protein
MDREGVCNRRRSALYVWPLVMWGGFKVAAVGLFVSRSHCRVVYRRHGRLLGGRFVK